MFNGKTFPHGAELNQNPSMNDVFRQSQGKLGHYLLTIQRDLSSSESEIV